MTNEEYRIVWSRTGKAVACLLAGVVLTVPAERNPERELRGAENAWARAALAADATMLNRVLADDLTYTHSSGRTETKPQFIESLTSGRMKYESAELDELTIKMYGKVAVVLSVRRMRAGAPGKISSFRARFQRVWVERAGQWQLVAHQATRLPD
jgi:ketosteroid isomerase-like protein